MIEIKLHQPIASADSAWMYGFGEDAGVFSLQFVQKLFAEHPDEQDFKFNIHCCGGEVEEGLAIYDALRTSGKNIYMNIEGACHSMAVTLLLAAPFENRTANPNCRALIHKVWTSGAWGTAEDLEKAAELVRRLQNSILDIYADRTKAEREELEQIMNEEKERTADELLAWGFISKVNSYNTNIKKPNMKNLIDKIANFLGDIKKEAEEAVNYVFYGEDGERLFETEREDDFLEVGMVARPDGDFDIGERIVVIREEVITEIREKTEEEATDEKEEELNALREEAATLREEATALREELNTLREQMEAKNAEIEEAKTLLYEAKKQITSNGKIGNRIETPNKQDTETMTSAERKAAVKERLRK